MSFEVSFTIYGAPRTKKNHGRRKYSFTRKRTFNVPSAEYEAWAVIAQKSLPLIRQQIGDAGVGLPITANLNCRAIIYRDAAAGDAVGYYQGLADWLENVGVVENDRQVCQWDGSRLKKDAALPRIEVTLSALAAEEQTPRAAKGAKKGKTNA